MTTSVLETPIAAAADAVVGPKIVSSDVYDLYPEDPLFADTYRCKIATTVSGGETARCNAQAFVKVVFVVGEVFVCAHHYTENRETLHEKALEVFDQRGSINKTASPSANAV